MTETRHLRLGISPCPNDTYAFHALLAGVVEIEGVELEVVLADVEELNRGLFDGRFDVAKASFAAALHLAGDYCVLESGSALGRGNGPLLLAGPRRRDVPERVLCPGEWTTAHLLYRLFHPGRGRVEQVVFSQILPALAAGEADLGVCIHEGRFTFEARGLEKLEDLGETWERETGEALPLGGILARKDLGVPLLARVGRAVRDSIAHSDAHPEEVLVTMRRHAQELDDDVLRAHVALYVNEETRSLGASGRRALDVLSRLARERGLLPSDAPALAVFRAEPPGRLFHVVDAGSWQPGDAPPRPASLDAEGFCHLSFAHQLEGTLAVHFAGSRAVHLVEVSADLDVRLEASRDGEAFPHLYRPLRREDLLRTWRLERSEGGLTAPGLAADAAHDDPPGDPVA